VPREDEGRRKRLEIRALHAVVHGEFEEAERLYRHLNSSLSLAVVALHRRAWERAAGKSLHWFDFWDTTTAEQRSQKGAEKDRALAIAALEIALGRMEERQPRSEAERKRRDRIVAKGRARLDAVTDWPWVRRTVREFVRAAPEYWGPFATERLGRNLLREGLAAAADLLLEDHVHLASYGARAKARARPDGDWDVPLTLCPHCLEDLTAESVEDARKIVPEIRDYMRVYLRADAPSPRDREHALLGGAEAVTYAGILSRVGDPVGGLCDRAEALLAAAPGLAPAGRMKEGQDALLGAFLAFHRARIAELRGRPDGALALLDGIVASAVEPWADRAAEAAAHVRALRDAAERSRRVSDLRSRCDAAKSAGDVAAERAALTDLLAVADGDALWERLAIVEVGAGAPDATDRATEAVRRGSREPALVAAIVGEGTRTAASDPRAAIPLFRLALHAGPLGPVAGKTFAAALAATGRWSEAGKAYADLAAKEPALRLDAARAYAKGGDGRKALVAIRALLDHPIDATAAREAFALAASAAPPDVLRPVAEATLARDPGNPDARALLDRLAAEDFRILAEQAARDRAEGSAASAKADWTRALRHLTALPPEFRDGETARTLARALEGLGRVEEARDAYASLPPSGEILEGRARCEARLKRFPEAAGTIRRLLDVSEDGAAFALGDDPDLLGLLAEARGDLREAATRLEDEGCLRSLGERARKDGDAVAEYAALARLADRHPKAAASVKARLGELDALVPVRAKGRAAAGLPTLVLCDTNVLLADLLEGACPEPLESLRRPSAAKSLRELRASTNVRLAVTPTVARELRAVLRYHAAVQEYAEDEDAVRAVAARAEELVASLDVARVARVAPRAADVERVRAFYRPFRAKLRDLTERKARRGAPGRSAAIRAKRTRGKADAPPLPEAADLRLLAEAAWIADAPVAGLGGVGLLSDDADFKQFRAEIERAFGVRVY